MPGAASEGGQWPSHGPLPDVAIRRRETPADGRGGHGLSHLADIEAVEPLGLLLDDLDVDDLGAVGARAHELDDAVDEGVLALEDRLHRAVAAVADPAGHASVLRVLACGVAEEHALDLAVHDHAPPDHGGDSAPRDAAHSSAELCAAASRASTSSSSSRTRSTRSETIVRAFSMLPVAWVSCCLTERTCSRAWSARSTVSRSSP